MVGGRKSDAMKQEGRERARAWRREKKRGETRG